MLTNTDMFRYLINYLEPVVMPLLIELLAFFGLYVVLT